MSPLLHGTAQINKLRADNPKLGIIKIARTLGCGVSTVQRVLAAT